jgi:XTP/dITP diphosphohydrolase
MVQILSARFPEVEFLTLADFENAPEPEENGVTYAENAAIKAVSACIHTGEWSLADDAGLEVDAMGGAPGLFSKRFEGETTPFPTKMAKILERLQGLTPEQRAARFRCCVALARPGFPVEVFEATCEGRIADAPSGAGGFGYDPIFWLPERGCTMADLTADEKHAVSHRGKALAMLTQWLLLSG